MKTSCVISNYNYEAYVLEAIDSALRQTLPFDEIIVVDDGSKDHSLTKLRARYGHHSSIQILAKENEGQLSCFNEGFARASGDIIFFLDADDTFEPDYVRQALTAYSKYPETDFLFCAQSYIGDQVGSYYRYSEDRDLGYSVIRTLYKKEWIGAATSCLSMRRRTLEKILPLPFIDDWQTRADDCLVFGSSVVGSRKRYLVKPLVNYRVHSKNHFFGKPQTIAANYRRRVALNRLFAHFEKKQCFDRDQLGDFVHREFQTIEAPIFQELQTYLRIGLSAPVAFTRRVSVMASMVGHYLKTLLASRTAPVESESVLADPAILKLCVGDNQAENQPKVNQPSQRSAKATA